MIPISGMGIIRESPVLTKSRQWFYAPIYKEGVRLSRLLLISVNIDLESPRLG
jgi:hypothetical protein